MNHANPTAPTPTTITMSIRTLLLVLLTTQVFAWPWDSEPTATLEDCGIEKNAVFKLLYYKIKQNDTTTYNPNKPVDISMIYANHYHIYEDIQAEFKYSLNGIPMPSQTENACGHGLECPQIPGEHEVSREIQFPTIPGKTKAEVLWKSGDTTLLCIRAMIFVPVLNVLRWR